MICNSFLGGLLVSEDIEMNLQVACSSGTFSLYLGNKYFILKPGLDINKVFKMLVVLLYSWLHPDLRKGMDFTEIYAM